jgi:hypothetical protein
LVGYGVKLLVAEVRDALGPRALAEAIHQAQVASGKLWS